jgi:pantoate--beta-alanine ligase
MKTLRTADEIRRYLAPLRAASNVGLIPTMGALHAGHTALFRAARRLSGQVVASIFVNPIQFDDPEDLAAYPRPASQDAGMAATAGVDALFVPGGEEMYGPGDATRIDVQGPAQGFEETHRPGHFRGVATVCLKLFNIVQPQVAFFGQKDAQQVSVVRQIVRDLHLDLKIEVVPTVRDADGLALSSRNVRLSAEERSRALAIPRALAAGVAARGGDAARAARAQLVGLDVEYADVAVFDGEPTLVIAARLGNVRLIDNVPLDHPERAGL